MNFRDYIEIREKQALEEGRLSRLLGAGILAGAGVAAAPWIAGRMDPAHNEPVRSATQNAGPKIPERPDDPTLARFYDSNLEKIAEIQASIDHYKSKVELTKQEEDRLKELEKQKAKFESILLSTQRHLKSSMALLKRLRSGEESFSSKERYFILHGVPRFMLTDKEAHEAGIIP